MIVDTSEARKSALKIGSYLIKNSYRQSKIVISAEVQKISFGPLYSNLE